MRYETNRSSSYPQDWSNWIKGLPRRRFLWFRCGFDTASAASNSPLNTLRSWSARSEDPCRGYAMRLVLTNTTRRRDASKPQESCGFYELRRAGVVVVNGCNLRFIKRAVGLLLRTGSWFAPLFSSRAMNTLRVRIPRIDSCFRSSRYYPCGHGYAHCWKKNP